MFNDYEFGFPCCYVANCQSITIAIITQTCQIGTGLFIHDLINGCSRGNDSYDVSLYQTYCLSRVFHLFNDGDLVTLGYESLDVAGNGMIWHTAHRYSLFHTGISARQNQVKFMRSRLGIIKEHLVEVSETVKDQSIRIALLYLQIMRHHGCVLCHLIYLGLYIISFLRVSDLLFYRCGML